MKITFQAASFATDFAQHVAAKIQKNPSKKSVHLTLSQAGVLLLTGPNFFILNLLISSGKKFPFESR